MLIEFLRTTAEQIGRQVGFVQRVSKISATVFAQVMIIGCLQHAEASLTNFAEMSAELGIYERISDRAVALLVGLLQASLRTFQSASPLPNGVLQQFSAMHLLDSSQIGLPDAMRSYFVGCGGDGPSRAVKVQLRFNYLTGCISAIELGDGCTPDQSCDLHVRLAEKGSVSITDLGYFALKHFAALAAKEAFFVSRFLTSTAVYRPDGTVLDVLALAQAQTASCAEYTVLVGQATSLPVRLIIDRLPPNQVAARRRKAIATARKKGYTLSARHLALLEFSCYITNVPPD